MGIRRYLKENWGAPFIIAFMALLILAAAELSLGLQDEANSIAVYAYYFLVVGVALQIASYVKYGEKEEQVSEAKEVKKVKEAEVKVKEVAVKKGRTVSKKLIVIVAIAIIMTISSVAFLLGTEKASQPVTQTTTETMTIVSTTTITTTTTTPRLIELLYFTKSLREPNGTVFIQVGVYTQGGKLPYTFTALWSDGFKQSIMENTTTPTTPIFSRLVNGTALPSYVIITVMSCDGQQASVNATLPAPIG